MHKYVSLFVLAALVALPVHAADSDKRQLTINIPGHAQIQRTVDVQITDEVNGRSRAAQGHSVYNDEVTRTGEGYIVRRTRLTHEPAIPLDSYDGSPAWTAWLGDAADITFTTGPYFYPRTVEDWPTVQARYLGILTRAAPAGANSPIRQVYAMLDTHSAPFQLLKADTFMAYARKYPLVPGQPYLEPATMPAPIGHGEVNVTSTFTLAKWDEAADDAEIDYDFAVDPTSMRDELAHLLPQLLPGTPAVDIQAAIAKARVDVSSHCHYQASIRTGLIRRGECTQTTVAHVLDYDETRKASYVVGEALVK